MAEKRVINGQEYIEINRKAEIGDIVININDVHCGASYIEVTYVRDDGTLYVMNASNDDDWTRYYVCDRKYRVLEPVAPAKSVEDMLVHLSQEVVDLKKANTELAYTVAKLERKVDRLEEALEKTDGKAEMLIDDVVMLDERTQPLTDDGAKEFAEGLSDVIEEYVNDRITRDQIRRAYD